MNSLQNLSQFYLGITFLHNPIQPSASANIAVRLPLIAPQVRTGCTVVPAKSATIPPRHPHCLDWNFIYLYLEFGRRKLGYKIGASRTPVCRILKMVHKLLFKCKDINVIVTTHQLQFGALANDSIIGGCIGRRSCTI